MRDARDTAASLGKNSDLVPGALETVDPDRRGAFSRP
jgi:hypothetical protein